MKNITLLCGLMILLSAGAAKARSQEEALSDQDKGSSLFKACKAEVRWMDSPGGNMDPSIPLGLRCGGYLEGFIDANALASPSLFCPDRDATMGTFARVYVNYMDQHPKLMDKHRGIGMVEAMRAAYPCSK